MREGRRSGSAEARPSAPRLSPPLSPAIPAPSAPTAPRPGPCRSPRPLPAAGGAGPPEDGGGWQIPDPPWQLQPRKESGRWQQAPETNGAHRAPWRLGGSQLGGARSLPRPQPQALHTAPPHGWSGRRSEVERRVEPAALSRP